MINKCFFWFFLLIGTSFYACQRKYVCPAYQSAFILDETKTKDFFSQFGQDSLPKGNLFVNKNKKGIIVRMKYHEKQKDINTVKMDMVYPPKPDSIEMAHADISMMTEDELDSLFMFSPESRISYNREQHIYMKYIGQYHKWNEPSIGTPQETEDEETNSEPVVEENKKKKKWFWNRNKKQKDAQNKEPEQEKQEVEDILQMDF